MLCLRCLKLYSRWVPLRLVFIFVKLHYESFLGQESLTKFATKPCHKLNSQ